MMKNWSRAGNGPQKTEQKALAIYGQQRLLLGAELEDKFRSLDRRIELLFERTRGRTIDFVGTQAGDDCSRVVLQFAQMSARRPDNRVLLLMTRPLSFDSPNGVRPWTERWDSISVNPEALEEYVQQYGDTTLYYAQMTGAATELSSLVHDVKFKTLMAAFRSRFDLILLDSPPITPYSSSGSLVSISDGVVLVVEAGKSREQAIKSQIREIDRNKGSVLGAVLVKRRYPIPEFIYRMI
jgi:protein-tyrosine kinase